MEDAAYYVNKKKKYEACKKIWKNIVTKRMYITGAIGSTVHGEYFTYDYDLPNDFFFSSRRRHTRLQGDWSSDVCSSDLVQRGHAEDPFAPQLERRRLQDHGQGLQDEH